MANRWSLACLNDWEKVFFTEQLSRPISFGIVHRARRVEANVMIESMITTLCSAHDGQTASRGANDRLCMFRQS